MNNSQNIRQLAAEGIGTFFLVFVGCGAIIVNEITGSLGHIGIAFAFGLVVMLMVTTTGHISGAHLNPAVTLAFTVTGFFPLKQLPTYFLAQFVGATTAAGALRLIFGNIANLGATVPTSTVSQSFILEIILTSILMFVIVAVATDTKAQGQLAAIMIGATVALDALWGGPISGASMNPARSFGPALVSGEWTAQWVYWLAPSIGAILGAWFYQFMREPKSGK